MAYPEDATLITRNPVIAPADMTCLTFNGKSVLVRRPARSPIYTRLKASHIYTKKKPPTGFARDRLAVQEPLPLRLRGTRSSEPPRTPHPADERLLRPKSSLHLQTSSSSQLMTPDEFMWTTRFSLARNIHETRRNAL